MREKFLLLNPPGVLRYLRDYYCSSEAKAAYYWHPGDLLIQSGILDRQYDVHIIDAMVQNISHDKCLRQIRELAPDYVYFLAGAGSWHEDFNFASKIKARKFFASGEIFLGPGEEFLQRFPFVDGALLDFTTHDILSYLNEDDKSISGMIYRRDEKIQRAQKPGGRTFEIPIPLHERFTGRYRMPLSRHKRFASLLTDHGCAHRCFFCNSWSSGYKTRTWGNLEAEAEHIFRLGYRQVFVKDMSFGADSGHAHMVMDLLRAKEFDWHCYAHPADLNRKILEKMAESGCYLVQLGVEHADSGILAAQNKKLSGEQAEDVIRICKDLGIMAGAHFVLGLPGENMDTLRLLEDFIATLNADYISVNILAPRFGSELRSELEINQRRLPGIHDVSFSGRGVGSSVPIKVLQSTRRRILRKFYARPSYFAGQMTRVGALRTFSDTVANGAAVLRNLL